MDQSENQDINRLKFFRQTLGMSQKEFGQSLNLARQNYNRIESGKGQISYSILHKLIDLYEINPLWLMKGWGKMKLDEDEKTAPIINITYEDGIVTKTGIEETTESYSVIDRLNEMEDTMKEFKLFMEEQKKKKNEKP